ncbi:MAG: crossover junction endodeoxyribonuclease RuvC [Acidimicrobiia bacterium]|nr:crossover junction endodeoxyribonuclease RuvC [Acidimicrobiia bacterium]
MLVMGVDPGLTTTGFGVVRTRAGSPDVRAAGVIRTEAGSPTGTRLDVLYQDLRELIEEVRPEVMAIERVFVNRNRLTATQVGQASGVIMLAASRAGLEVFEYSPSAVKAIVTGDGRASKKQVQQMVARRLGLRQAPAPADAADALAIALCHMQSMGNRLGRVEAAARGVAG